MVNSSSERQADDLKENKDSTSPLGAAAQYRES